MKDSTTRKHHYNPRMMLHDIHALKGRSRIIEKLKYTLPGAALVTLIVLICWPHIQRLSYSSKPTLAQTTPVPKTNNTATRPEYKNTDDKNQPYTITADHGLETSNEEVHLTNPRMEMHLQSGGTVILTSSSGIFNKITNQMHLINDVTLTHSQGYKIQTTQVWIDCKQGSAYGNSPVWGSGPAGSIEAKGFKLAEKGTKVSFIGGTQLLLTSRSQNQ